MIELGDYLVHRLVGEGGMGKVYEAEERLSKRRVALKVLHPELAKSEEGRRLFLNEMQILATLEHPNVVRSLASLEVAGDLVMVLEFLDGETLRAAFAGTRPSWTEAARIAASVAAALSAAHGKTPPVVHRDLKPENIMLLEGGVVKVMDFGIAKVVQAMNQTNTQSVGTLQYMSPEQIDARSIDHRSDLYCLGLVFYELLAGRAPFSSASPRELLNLQCTAEAPPLPDDVAAALPRGVSDLVFQLLEKAPEDRPADANEVAERLEPFLPAAPRGKTRGPASPRRASNDALPSPRTVPAVSVEEAKAPSASVAASRADRSDTAPSRVEGDARRAVPSSTTEPKHGAEARTPSARVVPERADTMAILEAVDRRRAPREVPRALAIGIVVALSLIAGFGAYALRATSSPAEVPTAGATAAAPRGER